MSAAKISMKSGRKMALLFSVGVCVTVGLQTFIALVFARYLDRHPEVIDVLQKIGVGIFFCLTLLTIQANRSDPVQLNRAGDELFVQKRYAEAMPYYRRVLEISPEDADAANDLGRG